MNLIITDVTEMHGGNYCVAGWNAQTLRMVRPLPNGSNWTYAMLTAHGVQPGAIVSFAPTGLQHQSSFPHRTEDTVVDPAQIANVQPGPINWFETGAPAIAPDVATAFGGLVQHNSVWNGVFQGVHVPTNAQCPSLGAVAVSSANLRFIEDFGKLKATLNDGASIYKLSVSSVKLKEAWRQGGMAAVPTALPQSSVFHVRLGLARTFGTPPVCYMMINGVHG